MKQIKEFKFVKVEEKRIVYRGWGESLDEALENEDSWHRMQTDFKEYIEKIYLIESTEKEIKYTGGL